MEQHPTQLRTIEILPQDRPDVKIVKLDGPLTIHNFAEFQEMTRKQPLPRLLIVDLSDVPYIDSAALGTFVGIHIACEGTEHKYALVGANERLWNLFDMTNAKEFLVTFPSMDEAIEKLG